MTIKQDMQFVNTNIKADNRADAIVKFTQWVNEFPYEHHISLNIFGNIGDIPVECHKYKNLVN